MKSFYYRPAEVEVRMRLPEFSLVCAMLWRAYLDATGNCEDERMAANGFKYQESAIHWLFNLDENPEHRADYLVHAAGLESQLEKIQQAVLNQDEVKKNTDKILRWRYG